MGEADVIESNWGETYSDRRGVTFFSPVATAELSKFAGILSAALSQHHFSGFGKEIQPVHSEGDQPWVFFGRHPGM